ncbi:MAG: hypothetical protein H6620_10635 [Halobacteriovoraceae bacterium]|nr:hypothetical protein [Halobacteriovoraceae bacterium]
MSKFILNIAVELGVLLFLGFLYYLYAKRKILKNFAQHGEKLTEGILLYLQDKKISKQDLDLFFQDPLKHDILIQQDSDFEDLKQEYIHWHTENLSLTKKR